MSEEKRFSVVITVPRYCPVTDAILGSQSAVWSKWDTRDEANFAAEEYVGDRGYDPEEHVEVLPREAKPVRAAIVDLANEDIPF